MAGAGARLIEGVVEGLRHGADAEDGAGRLDAAHGFADGGEERARVDRKNNGGWAANACLKMIALKRSFMAKPQ